MASTKPTCISATLVPVGPVLSDPPAPRRSDTNRCSPASLRSQSLAPRAMVVPSAIAPAASVGPSAPSVPALNIRTFSKPGDVHQRPPAQIPGCDRPIHFHEWSRWFRRPRSRRPARFTGRPVARISRAIARKRARLRAPRLGSRWTAPASESPALVPLAPRHPRPGDCFRRSSSGLWRKSGPPAWVSRAPALSRWRTPARNFVPDRVFFKDRPRVGERRAVSHGGARANHVQIVPDHIRQNQRQHRGRISQPRQAAALHQRNVFPDAVDLMDVRAAIQAAAAWSAVSRQASPAARAAAAARKRRRKSGKPPDRPRRPAGNFCDARRALLAVADREPDGRIHCSSTRRNRADSPYSDVHQSGGNPAVRAAVRRAAPFARRLFRRRSRRCSEMS